MIFIVNEPLFAFENSIEKDGIYMEAGVDNEICKYSEPIRIIVLLSRWQPIIYANVKADVKRPDGSVVYLSLNDNQRDGDRMPLDGCYTAMFKGFKGKGVYIFHIIADNKDRKTKEGVGFSDLPPPGEAYKPKPLQDVKEPFSIELTFQINCE